LTNVLEYKNYKIIYRPYAALFMCMCVDATDNEFAVLETIHLFVEIMDLYFEKVRELDLLLAFHKVYALHRRRRGRGDQQTADCREDEAARRPRLITHNFFRRIWPSRDWQKGMRPDSPTKIVVAHSFV
jgi:hypothetical protein